ncbi:MAG: bifunctional UDP-N-acetylglucosamine diphosphorylase/glucosamine-1-phosphate N-acetyltransferase GlmU [Geminicoccaceae bacterium]
MAHAHTTIILAAGKGSRMRASRPKVLHPLAGKPMLGHVIATSRAAKATKTVLVLAPGMDEVATFAKKTDPAIQIALQDPPLGTGHAVMAARELLPREGVVSVLFGDTPLLRARTIELLIDALRRENAAVAALGMDLNDATGYGRLVHDGSRLLKIVEQAAADETIRAIRIANAGIMAFDAGRLGALLDRVPERTARDGNREYYLTDTVEAAVAEGWSCCSSLAPEEEGLGVNDRIQLAEAEAVMQARLRQRAMAEGVTMQDPDTVYLSWDTVIGRDVTLEPNVVIGSGVTIEEGVTIRAFSHIALDMPKDKAPIHIRSGAVIGPFARVRSGSDLGPGVRVGNFVEVKNARLAAGAKANHLAYLGDAEVGERSNIGAGTITCNYDGFAKWPTRIGKDVFVGSNSTLVAPVDLGDASLVTAGSWVHKSIPEGASVAARGAPEVKEGGARKLEAYLRARAETKSD